LLMLLPFKKAGANYSELLLTCQKTHKEWDFSPCFARVKLMKVSLQQRQKMFKNTL
jgi:hypothetical protein